MSQLSTGVMLSAANKGLFVLYLHVQFHIHTRNICDEEGLRVLSPLCLLSITW